MGLILVQLLGAGLAAYLAFGLLWVHREAFTRERKSLLTAVLCLDLVACVLAAVGVFNHSLFVRWMQEDAWAEWATFFSFVTAGVLTIVFALRFHTVSGSDYTDSVAWRAYPFGPDTETTPAEVVRGSWYTLGLLGVAAFCFFVAAEEISWGQRLFAFKPPAMFLELNDQQEFNAHNLLHNEDFLGFKVQSEDLVAAVTILYGVLWAFLARFLLQRRPALGRWFSATGPPLLLSPWFVAVALTEFTHPFSFVSETTELVFGLLFLTIAVLRFTVGPEPKAIQRWNKWPAVAVALMLTLGLATPPLAEQLLFGSDQQLAAKTKSELELLREDVLRPGVAQPKLLRMNRVHHRIFSAIRTGFLHFGEQSQFLKGERTPAEGGEPSESRYAYFVDPWYNPYWILYSGTTGWAVLYSFGENRRRDSDFTDWSESSRMNPDSDDIAVSFRLPDVDLVP